MKAFRIIIIALIFLGAIFGCTEEDPQPLRNVNEDPNPASVRTTNRSDVEYLDYNENGEPEQAWRRDDDEERELELRYER